MEILLQKLDILIMYSLINADRTQKWTWKLTKYKISLQGLISRKLI